MTKQERIDSLAPLVNGKRVARKLRIYDNGGETLDRFTAVFTGNYKDRNGRCEYVGFNTPQSFWQHGDHDTVIDYPSYGHLGKKIAFSELPDESRKQLMLEYCETWGLPKELAEAA